MALTMEQKAKVVVLRGLGRSYQTIAEEVGVAKDSVMKVCEEEDNSVREYRRELVEEVSGKYKLLFRDRLESLGEFAGRLKKELEERNLSEVSTPVIARLYLETLKAIQEQVPLSARNNYQDGLTVEDYRGNAEFMDFGGVPKLYRNSTEFVRVAKALLEARFGKPRQMEE